MRRFGIRTSVELLAVLGASLAVLAGPAQAAVGDVVERTVPGSTGVGGLNRITNGPDGNIWFTAGGANTIGRMTPAGNFGGINANGDFNATGFPIPTPDSNPQDITTGPDGALWFTEGAGKIGRITTSGQITEFPIGLHFPSGITTGPDGALWFIVDDGDPFNPGQIGRMSTAGDFQLFPVKAGSTPAVGITTGPDGNLWYTATGGSNRVDGRIQRMDRFGNVNGDFAIPTPFSDPSRLVTGPDGNLWFTEQGAVDGNLSPGQIGRMTPSGQVTEFQTPDQNPFSNPAGIAVGPDGNLWYTEYSYKNVDGTQHGGNRIGRITTAGDITEFGLPTQYARADGITGGPNGDPHLYFTESPNDFAYSAIGSIEGLQFAPAPDPLAAPPATPPAIAPIIAPQPAAVVAARKLPRLTSRVTKKRGRTKTRFNTTGRVLLPSGVSKSSGCRGIVAVQIKRRTKTLSHRRVKVRSNCTFSATVSIFNSRLRGRGRSKVVARFQGNARLKARSASRKLV